MFTGAGATSPGRMVFWSGVLSLLFGEVVLVWYLVNFGFVTGFSMIVSAMEAMSLRTA